MIYFLCMVLFCVGLYCVLRKRNLIKIVIGIIIIENAVNLAFILVGYRFQGRSPILAKDVEILNDLIHWLGFRECKYKEVVHENVNGYGRDHDTDTGIGEKCHYPY